MLISEAEVYNIAFNRDIEIGLIKPSQILVAQSTFIGDYFNEDFYNLLVDNTDDNYTDFIEEYIKPIIAWGVLYNNFEYISNEITDKGVVQLLTENTALIINRETRLDIKIEIKKNIYRLIRITRQYAASQKAADNSLFELYDANDENIVQDLSVIKFLSNKSFNLKPI